RRLEVRAPARQAHRSPSMSPDRKTLHRRISISSNAGATDFAPPRLIERYFSDEQSRSAQRHEKEGAGHHAPEARDHGRHHHELEAAAFDTHAAQGVAHDDEGRGEHQERNGGKTAWYDSFLQQPKAGRPFRQHLIAAGESTRERKPDA